MHQNKGTRRDAYRNGYNYIVKVNKFHGFTSLTSYEKWLKRLL
jgi:hypothetical protein